ncbi:paeninodin family lasso peptide [Paenibacillus protaetiae]|uniref:Paeninodin family lasso peptide n=1 Tax=Paenibacillus protaetiae TaxID=2509456 RepID=A0A4P6EUT8_9BACL|nr:paeninodin family lasso peptide [Paenibacillus protaetiae]QAY66752.1 paeninodin family lasso peptide [Paenibacillus protaetiae]
MHKKEWLSPELEVLDVRSTMFGFGGFDPFGKGHGNDHGGGKGHDKPGHKPGKHPGGNPWNTDDPS